MSLDQLLNDIKDDTINTELEQPSLENLTPGQKESTISLKVSSLSDKTLEKVNTLFNMITIRQSVQGLTKVDFKIAHEVFTMLPDLKAADKAKVTSYPSIINKAVLTDIFKDVENTVPEDVYRTIVELSQDITSNQTVFKTLPEALKEIQVQLEEEHRRLTAGSPLVIYNQKTYNLYTDPMDIYFQINDKELHFEKYDNVLNDKVCSLIGLDSFKKLFDVQGSGQSFYDSSLEQINGMAIRLHSAVEASIAVLNKFQEDANAFLGQNDKPMDETTISLVNNVNLVIKELTFIQTVSDILNEPNNILFQLKDVLSFLET